MCFLSLSFIVHTIIEMLFLTHQLLLRWLSNYTNYRELLTGVETLKNAAEVLEFIDRISEVKQK